MKCKNCGSPTSMRTNRTLKSGITKRKRRCPQCGLEFATYEIREDDIKSLIRGFEPETTYQNDSLCWSCSMATGFCSWSRNFEPVPGWDADATEIKNNYGNNVVITTQSFHVKACPLYRRDGR